jgi:hypothetical protein
MSLVRLRRLEMDFIIGIDPSLRSGYGYLYSILELNYDKIKYEFAAHFR